MNPTNNNNNRAAHTIVIGSADIPKGKVERIDDFIFRCQTPIQIARSSSNDRALKVIRCQIVCDAGIQPNDVIVHCNLCSTMESQQNYAICPANLTFHNRLAYPIYGQDTDTHFEVWFTDGYGLPVRVETWTMYANINY